MITSEGLINEKEMRLIECGVFKIKRILIILNSFKNIIDTEYIFHKKCKSDQNHVHEIYISHKLSKNRCNYLKKREILEGKRYNHSYIIRKFEE